MPSYSLIFLDSVRGAAQLSKDFDYLRDFIEVYFNDETVKSRILQSKEMHRFNVIIHLLADQPTSRSRKHINTSLSSRNRVAPMEQTGEATYELEDKAQWVALRSGIPITKTLFPCLPPSITDGC